MLALTQHKHKNCHDLVLDNPRRTLQLPLLLQPHLISDLAAALEECSSQYAHNGNKLTFKKVNKCICIKILYTLIHFFYNKTFHLKTSSMQACGIH